MTTATVTIRILSYWRCGDGSANGVDLNARCVRDPVGLPCVPGKHLKGLLRDAVRQLAQYDPTLAGAEAALFGGAGFVAATTPDAAPQPQETHPGALLVEAARAPADLIDWMRTAQRDHPKDAAALAATLFTPLSATAIDRTTGTVQAHTLRRVEAAAPITLTAGLRWDPAPYPVAGAPDCAAWTDRWRDVVRSALTFVRGVGADRSRGLGRCEMWLNDEAEAAR